MRDERAAASDRCAVREPDGVAFDGGGWGGGAGVLRAVGVAVVGGVGGRGEYCWKRTRQFREKAFHGFGIDGPNGALDGYVFLLQTRGDATGDGIAIEVSDLALSSEAAGRRLLGFLADFSTTTKEIVLAGPPTDRVEPADLTPRRDLEARGVDAADHGPGANGAYGSAATRGRCRRWVPAERALPVVRANDGSWTLSVEHGRAEVTREATAPACADDDDQRTGGGVLGDVHCDAGRGAGVDGGGSGRWRRWMRCLGAGECRG